MAKKDYKWHEKGHKTSFLQAKPSYIRRHLNNKKAIATWISWVLLLTFVIFLGTTVFYWMDDYTRGRVDELKKRAQTSDKCDFVGIEVFDVIEKNAQTLNMKVTNRYNLRVNQLVITLFDSEHNPVLSNTTNITLKPNDTKSIDIPKNFSVSVVQAVPVIIDEEGKQIFCVDKLYEANVTR